MRGVEAPKMTRSLAAALFRRQASKSFLPCDRRHRV